MKMVAKEVEVDTKKKGKAAKKGKGKKGQKVEEEEEEDENKPPELVPKTTRTLFTHLTSYSDIEEFFLSVSKEYAPFIDAMINDSRSILDEFTEFIQDQEGVEKLKTDLNN